MCERLFGACLTPIGYFSAPAMTGLIEIQRETAV